MLSWNVLYLLFALNNLHFYTNKTESSVNSKENKIVIFQKKLNDIFQQLTTARIKFSSPDHGNIKILKTTKGGK